MKNILLIVLTFLVSTYTFSQLPFLEDFESGSGGFTTSIVQSTDNSGDYFILTNGSNISTTFTGVTGSYFAAQDIDAAPNNSGSTATLVISGIDISGCSALSFSMDIAEDDDGSNQDWDGLDYFHVTASIDGGASQNLIWVEGQTTGTNTEPKIDTDFNGLGDGTSITSAFQNFSNSISGTGSTLMITITIDLDSGDEDIAFDNISVTGTCAACGGPVAEPTNEATGQSVSNVSCTSADVNWTNGTGSNNTLVVMSTSLITGIPIDGTAYAADATFGSGSTIAAGEYVVNNGVGGTVNLSGLSAGTTYFVKIFEYNGSAVNCEENYLTGGVTASFTTATGCASPGSGCADGILGISGGGCGCLGGCDLSSIGGPDCGGGTSGNCSQPVLIEDILVPDGCTYTVTAEIKNRPNGCSSSGADGGDFLKVDIVGGSKTAVEGGGNASISDSYSLAGPGTIRVWADVNRADEVVTYSTTAAGPFCVACQSILPVQLIEFKAEPNYVIKAVDLTWATQSEINNDYFIIEKSDDGLNFEEFHRVSGLGNSNQYFRYTIFDGEPVVGAVNYYRLKQVDFNGDYTYSDVKSVYFENIYDVNIYPNPSNGAFKIEGKIIENSEIKLYNSMGKLMDINYVKTDHAINVSSLNLIPGFYVVEINYLGKLVRKKITIY